MDQPREPQPETFNPWSVVNLVFDHLVGEGLHPILGEAGDPGAPAAELLRSLGIQPAAEGNLKITQDVRDHLAQIRSAFFGDGEERGGSGGEA
jgi:hypothetical protein